MAGGGRTRRGALQTWRPGALPGGRRGGAGGRGRQPAEVSLITWIRRDDVEANVANVAKTWKLTWTPYSYLVGSLEADRLLYLQFLESTIYFYNFY